MLRTRRYALALLLAAALPVAAARAAAPPATPLEPRSTVLADIPEAALDARLVGDVVVGARVTRLGTVDSVLAVGGDRRLRDSALDAVRWYLYPPQAGATWTTATVHFDGTVDAVPLAIDVRGRALDAERAGLILNAIDAWAGVLNRTGLHPTMRNPWAVRMHIAQLQRRLPAQPDIRGKSVNTAITARIEQQRTVADQGHADLVKQFENAEIDMPWWAELYQWEAASLLGCGRSGDAMRALLVFRAGTRDSAMVSLADAGLARVAAGDSLGAGEQLKKGGRQFEGPAPEGSP